MKEISYSVFLHIFRDQGPAALIFMAGGAAAGYAFVRRRRKSI